LSGNLGKHVQDGKFGKVKDTDGFIRKPGKACEGQQVRKIRRHKHLYGQIKKN
jgi:hypothetical protein